MRNYRADIHIHTVLSPCASLEMSPTCIVNEARAKNLQIIGITDHNSTLQCALVQQLASRVGIFTLMGVEVTTREELHCLSFFPSATELSAFQYFLEEKQEHIPNLANKMGYQVVVDEQENIIHEVEYWLHTALSVSVNELEKMVHSLGGIFIPAHIDRPRFSLTSQLGFVPEDLNADAFEIFNPQNLSTFSKNIQHKTFIRNSDSHSPSQIGKVFTQFVMPELSFDAIREALRTNSVIFEGK